MASDTQAQAFSASTGWVVTRHWVRRDPPVGPFIWRAALPLWGGVLLLCYALWPFARDEIQASVRHEARAELDASGFAWVTLDVSGQNVRLSGTPPAAGDGEVALELARIATCPTWFGRYPCAVAVVGDFAEPRAPVPASTDTVAPAVTAPPQAAAQPCETVLAQIVAGSKIEFASGAARLEAHSAAVLDALATATAECPGVLRIEGHTDALGQPQNNLALSLARAESVRQALIERGVAASRLRAQGFGGDQPIADNRSAESRAKNRRIEFRVANDTP